MTRSLRLPMAGGTLADFALTNTPVSAPIKPAGGHRFNRVAYAAAHIVVDPFADNDPWLDRNIDWERTTWHSRAARVSAFARGTPAR